MLPNIGILFNNFNTLIIKYWQNRYWCISISILVFLVFSLIYFPEVIRKRVHDDWTGNDVLVQQFVNNKIANPFKPTENLLPHDHFSKRDLRITPYILANAFGLNSLRLFYLQILLLPLFIWLSVKVIYKATNNYVLVFWGTIALLFSYVGNSFNFDTLFYDSYAYFGLLLSLYFYKNPLGILFLVASYFVDERSVAPSLIIPLFAGLTIYPIHSTNKDFATIFQKMIVQNRTFWLVFISLVIYATIRIIFYLLYHLQTPVGEHSGVTLGLGFIHGAKIPYAIFSSLKLNLLLIIFACFYLFKKKHYIVAVWFTGVFLVSFLVGTAVEDVTRSLAYSFLLVYIVYLLVAQIKEKASKFIYLIAFVNILTPTYSLLLNLYKVEAFSWLIHFPQHF